MDIRKVKKLIEMLESSNLEEIEIKEGEESVRLVKNKSATSLTNAPFIATEDQTQEITEPKKETEPEVITGNQIKSPMVGTFYSSPSPGAKPFVEPGDIIKEGDVVCIVEAMKMMNEIKSDFSGTIKKVHLDNADPVEFGQALFTVE
jgi:acetyl-CoA carboxylase biotin carboxyl carrier protein|tara:strand:- start:120 stop:560 length:441 start_codon:yes stop_codon:yes gene_type:complete